MAEKILNVKAVLLLGALLLAGCKNPSQASVNPGTDNPGSGSENPDPSPPNPTDIVNIPDAKFLKFLVQKAKVDTNGDGQISYEEAWAVTELANNAGAAYPIDDLTGLETFINVERLEFTGNGSNDYRFTTIPLKELKSLKEVKFNYIRSPDLDFGENGNLQNIWLQAPIVKTLDLSKSPNVTKLDATDININLTTIYVASGFQKPDEGWNVPSAVQIIEKP